MHHFRRDPATLSAFEADKAVGLHCAQCARQVGFGLARETCQLVERTGSLAGLQPVRRFPLLERDRAGRSVLRAWPFLLPPARAFRAASRPMSPAPLRDSTRSAASSSAIWSPSF